MTQGQSTSSSPFFRFPLSGAPYAPPRERSVNRPWRETGIAPDHFSPTRRRPNVAAMAAGVNTEYGASCCRPAATATITLHPRTRGRLGGEGPIPWPGEHTPRSVLAGPPEALPAPACHVAAACALGLAGRGGAAHRFRGAELSVAWVGWHARRVKH